MCINKKPIMRKLFKTLALSSFSLLLSVGISCTTKDNTFNRHGLTASFNERINLNQEVVTSVPNEKISDKTIQVAILLDTSNSMDGLIEQAKSRLWNIVNTLTTLKYEGDSPEIEISLYEYGNDGLEQAENYIRKVTPLTQDLDLISEKLFSLNTNGGAEYCGAVISQANDQLEWSDSKSAMKLIYIAGNEPFTQGEISYKEAISDARKSDIYINTIFCGDKQEGIQSSWKDGASLGDGKYFNIDSDKKVIYIATPYDVQIEDYNKSLNATYYGYGQLGVELKAKQTAQDSNASSISKENYVERSIVKSKKSAYKNDSWDLVDRVEKDANFLKNAKDAELPKELKGKSLQEKEDFVALKTKERNEIQKKIAELSIKRNEYIAEEVKNNGADQVNDLGVAIENSILELAKIKGFEQ